MKTAHIVRLLTLAGVAPLLAHSALAQDDSYYYGGLSVGRAHGKLDANGITSKLTGPGLGEGTTTSQDNRDTTYKVFGGYQFNRNFALEGGFFKLGQFGFSSVPAVGGTLDGKVRVQGLNLDVVGTLPLGEQWALLGRVGASYAKTRDTFDTTGAAVVSDPNPSKREANYKVGAGLQYAISSSVMMRGEVEHYRVSDAVNNHVGVNAYTVSLVIPFGRSSSPAPRAAAPAYVAPAPTPAPAVVAAPAPVVVVAPVPAAPAPVALRRVSFSAESLFGFDNSAVKPEGRPALDTFAKELEGTNFDSIKVEGHTDRIGTEAYNQKLSLQRADAVKAYLVSADHVDAAKIATDGKGESMPVTKADDCKGNHATAKLVTCLQPDRRVEIEVNGTR